MIVLPFVLPLITFAAIWHVIRRWISARRAKVMTSQSLPGPTGLPWIGPVAEIPRLGAHFAFKKWADQHGPIFEVTLLGQRTLFVSDERWARRLLVQKSAIYSGRPPINALVDSQSKQGSGTYLPLMSKNDDLAHQKKAWILAWTVAKHNGSVANAIEIETANLLLDLLSMTNRPVTDWTTSMEFMTARVSGRLTFGDPLLAPRIHRETFLWQKHISPGGFLPNLAWPLTYLPHYLSPWKMQEHAREESQQAFYHAAVQKVASSMSRGIPVPPSYAKTYLSSLSPSGSQAEAKSHANLASLVPNPKHATALLGMMATFNNLTIAQPLISFIRCLAAYPEHQAHIQAELVSVLSDSASSSLLRMPSPADIPQLPYLRACLAETARFRPPIPTSIPHELEADDVIPEFGAHLPAGTPVFVPSYTLSRSPALFPSPYAFQPSRWLDPASPTFRAPLTKFPNLTTHSSLFGYGRRYCIGTELTEMEIFLAAARVCWAFSWALTPRGEAEVCEGLGDGEQRAGMRVPREMKEGLIVGKTGACEVLFQARREVAEPVAALKAALGDMVV